MDGKHVDIQHPSNLKTESVDLELNMKQQTILSKNSIVLEIANEIVDQVMHDIDKLKCEVLPLKIHLW